MLKLVCRTSDAVAPLLLRLTLAVVIFPHGAQKVLGLWGGPGFSGTLDMFEKHMGISAPLALCAMAAEFLGSIGLVLGLLTRLAAFGIAAVMTVAVLTVHLQNGFFMNWSGKGPGEGFEYHILAAGIALTLIVTGGGALSVDRGISGAK